jgi:hypothetical protein
MRRIATILSNAQAALYLLAPKSPNFLKTCDALRDIMQGDNRADEGHSTAARFAQER